MVQAQYLSFASFPASLVSHWSLPLEGNKGLTLHIARKTKYCDNHIFLNMFTSCAVQYSVCVGVRTCQKIHEQYIFTCFFQFSPSTKISYFYQMHVCPGLTLILSVFALKSRCFVQRLVSLAPPSPLSSSSIWTKYFTV